MEPKEFNHTPITVTLAQTEWAYVITALGFTAERTTHDTEVYKEMAKKIETLTIDALTKKLLGGY